MRKLLMPIATAIALALGLVMPTASAGPMPWDIPGNNSVTYRLSADEPTQVIVRYKNGKGEKWNMTYLPWSYSFTGKAPYGFHSSNVSPSGRERPGGKPNWAPTNYTCSITVNGKVVVSRSGETAYSCQYGYGVQDPSTYGR